MKLKKVIKSNVQTIADEQDTEIIYWLGQVLTGNNVSVDEYIEFIDSVSKDDISSFAQRVNINTIYFLKN